MKRLLLALAVVGAWAAPAFAEPPQPPDGVRVGEMTATPTTLRAGDLVTVSGAGCGPGNQVSFELWDEDLHSSASGVARGDGTFAQSISLPPTTKVGRNWLTARCLSPEAEQIEFRVVLLVSRPEFVVTWVNVIFGLGTAFVTAGIGLAMLKQPDRHHPSKKRVRRRRKRRRHRGLSSSSSSKRRRPGAGRLPGGSRTGAGRNGSRDAADRSIEVD